MSIKINKRYFLKGTAFSLLAARLMIAPGVWARQYLTLKEAQQVLFPGIPLRPIEIEISKQQKSTIQRASKTRVRSLKIIAWRTPTNDWFILDTIIGKHENIDMAFALNNEGKVLGLEILEYRESYGHEIRIPRWRAQFYGRDNSEHLRLDKQIKNISGATLSCRHVTDGVNRWLHTWAEVLKTHQEEPIRSDTYQHD